MIRNLLIITLTSASLLNSSLTFALDTSKVITAVGQYEVKTSPNSRDTIEYPLMLESNDTGLTWSARSMTPSLPNNFHNRGIINSIYCEAGNCLLFGSYKDKNVNEHPLIYKSTDNGTNWSIVTPPALPKDYLSEGVFSDVHCDKEVCIALGQPLFAISYNGGLNWYYPYQLLDDKPKYAYDLEFRKGYCKEEICVVVGSYKEGRNEIRPLLVISSNGGSSWNYVDTLPDDFLDDGYLNDIAIINKVIIAVGTYNKKAHGNIIRYPLQLQSQDAGLTWKSLDMQPNLPDNFRSNGELKSIYCQEKSCSLVGTYTDRNRKYHPLLLKGSYSWGYWERVTPFPKDYLNGGDFGGVHCDKRLCIAIGQYMNKNEQWKPLLAASHDSGLTWFYPETVISNLPIYAGSPELTKGYCNDQLCVVSGMYHVGINETRPLVAQSTDGGLTWNYISTLPDDFVYRGVLKNISIH